MERGDVRRLIVAALGAALTLVCAGPALGAPATAPSVATKSQRPKNVTFGAAPSNGKVVDGRPYFTFSTTPGGRLSDHLAITNATYKAEQLAVYPVDATPGGDGSIAFPTQTAPRREAGAWIAVGTPGASGLVTIRPRSTDILPIRVNVPYNASP